MSESLQNVVDELATTYNASVVVSSHNLESWAASSQGQYIDHARTLSLIERRTPDNMRAHLDAFDLDRAREPFIIPASLKLEVKSRLCVPIRGSNGSLAFMWILNEAEDYRALLSVLADSDLSDRLLAVLEQGRWGDFGKRGQESDTITAFLSGASFDAEDRRLSVILASPKVSVITLWSRVINDKPDTVKLNSMLADATEPTSRKRTLFGVVDNSYVIVACADEAPSIASRLCMNTSTMQTLGVEGIGISTQINLPVNRSRMLAEALFASRVSAVSLSKRPVANYHELGYWRLFEQLTLSPETLFALAPDIYELARNKNQTHLETLRSFLSLNSDTTATAAALQIHRTTLQYRLEKLREIVGAKLDSGAGVAELWAGIAFNELISASTLSAA